MDLMAEAREALEAARTMRDEVCKAADSFRDKDPKLAAQLCSAAERTVVNLELALKELEKEQGPIM